MTKKKRHATKDGVTIDFTWDEADVLWAMLYFAKELLGDDLSDKGRVVTRRLIRRIKGRGHYSDQGGKVNSS